MSEREARVYLTALSLGGATATEIAHASQITRTTAYNVIEALIELGLMSAVESKSTKSYVAEPPERVVEMMKQRADELLRRMEAIKDALPELAAIENRRGSRPRMYMYEGKEGIKQLSRRYEECSGDFLEIVPYDELREFIAEDEYEDHREKLVKRGVNGKMLVIAKKPPVEWMKKFHERYGWSVRYIEPDDAPACGQISVKGDEVYGVSYDGIPIGTVIENPALAQSVRKLFALAWAAAPKDISFP